MTIGHKQFDIRLTPIWPHMTFDPSISLHFNQGFFLPNLVAIKHSWAIWSLIDLGWPCMIFNSSIAGVLPSKFSSHAGIPEQFDPCMTFDPGNALHLSQGFFLPNLVAIGIPEQFNPWLTLVDPCMTFDPGNALHFSQGFLISNLVVCLS